MVLCDSCDGPIDSDHDPDCFLTDPWGRDAGIQCECCRERAYERHQAMLMESGGYPTLRDQQLAAMKFK